MTIRLYFGGPHDGYEVVIAPRRSEKELAVRLPADPTAVTSESTCRRSLPELLVLT